jgi:hypothetical protein
VSLGPGTAVRFAQLADYTVAGAPHMYHGHILRQDDRGLMSR